MELDLLLFKDDLLKDVKAVRDNMHEKQNKCEGYLKEELYLFDNKLNSIYNKIIGGYDVKRK